MGFDHTGIDALEDSDSGKRSAERESFSYFSGSRSQIKPASIEHRRRFVVINGLADASTHQPWEIMLNEVVYNTRDDADRFRLAIDSLKPAIPSSGPPSGDYITWVANQSLPETQQDSSADPDHDGLSNLVEFHHGTDPQVANAPNLRLRVLRQSDGAYQLRYPRTAKARNVRATLLSSENLIDWQPYEAARFGIVPHSDPGIEERVLTLPGLPNQAFRLDVSLVD